MPRCRCMEHGLEYIMFYVQKYIAHLVACSGPLLVHDRPLEALAFVKLASWMGHGQHLNLKMDMMMMMNLIIIEGFPMLKIKWSRNCLIFILFCHLVAPHVASQNIIIGSGNALVSSQCHAITRTNGNLGRIELFGIKLKWNLYQNTKRFFQKNAFENVFCKMAAILFRLPCAEIDANVRFLSLYRTCELFVMLSTAVKGLTLNVRGDQVISV